MHSADLPGEHSIEASIIVPSPPTPERSKTFPAWQPLAWQWQINHLFILIESSRLHLITIAIDQLMSIVSEVGLEPPILETLDEDAVRVFLDLRETYLRRLHELNGEIYDEADMYKPLSLKSSIRRGPLRIICMRKLKSSVVDVTEEELETYLSSFLPNSLQLTNSSRLVSLLKDKIVDPGRKHTAQARIDIMWGHLEEVILLYNLESMTEKKRMLKTLRKVFLDAIRHHDLKIRVEQAYDNLGEMGDAARESLCGLYDLLSDCATKQTEADGLNLRLKAKRARSSDENGSSDHGSRKKTKYGGNRMSEEKKKKIFGAKYKSPEERARGKRSRDTSSASNDDGRACWNCKGKDHLANRCPKFKNVAEKKEFFKKRKTSHGAAQVSTVDDEKQGQICICEINRELRTEALLDSGAYTTILDAETARKLELHLDQDGALQKLPLAVKESCAKVLGKSVVTLSLLLSAGKIVIANVPVVVVEGRMDFVLVGADVLERLQVDPLGNLNEKMKADHRQYVFDFLLCHDGERGELRSCLNEDLSCGA